MFLDAAGHYSVVVVGAGGAGAIAYFGDYKLDEAAGAITLHIDASTRAAAAGRDEKRLVQLDGDQLTVESDRSAQSLGAVTLVWKRAD
jgi:hypothetical protein